MSNFSDEYRKLVRKLELIESGQLDELDLPPGAPDEPGYSASSTGPNPNIDDASRKAAMAQVDKLAVDGPQATSQIPTIEAPSFKAAYAQAAKQKLKMFKWCGTYKVQAAPPIKKPQGASGMPEPKKSQFPTFDVRPYGPGANTGGVAEPGVQGGSLPPMA